MTSYSNTESASGRFYYFVVAKIINPMYAVSVARWSGALNKVITVIKINKAEFLSALLCQAKNDVRYYLNGVCVDSEGFVVSTDGHRMFVGKAITDQETSIFSLKGKAPAKFDHVLIDTKNKSAVFADNRGDVVQTTPVDIVDGRFPDWRRVSDYKEGKVSAIGLDLRYLSDAAKAAKYFGKRRARIDMQDAASAVHIRLSDNAFMVVMPTRL